MGWYSERFQPKAGRVQCNCRACGRSFWVPPSEVERRITCGRDCANALKAKRKEERRSRCAHCGLSFIPRSTQVAAGEGRYCSLACSTNANRQLWAPEARKRAAQALMRSIQEGRYTPPKGAQHHQWRGGPAAYRARAQADGRLRNHVRRYRAANPEKTREFSRRRRSLKLGRLPAGTVKRIGEAQRWHCAICRTAIKRGYHVDHILPLARGGRHEANNIQLLCLGCNVRKSAKHPIDYMQELGFLL